MIDEFEDVPPSVMSELLHVFRAMYQKREHHKLQALALVGGEYTGRLGRLFRFAV